MAPDKSDVVYVDAQSGVHTTPQGAVDASLAFEQSGIRKYPRFTSHTINTEQVVGVLKARLFSTFFLLQDFFSHRNGHCIRDKNFFYNFAVGVFFVLSNKFELKSGITIQSSNTNHNIVLLSIIFVDDTSHLFFFIITLA